MLNLTRFAILAYIAMFVAIPFLRSNYLRHDHAVLFWILVLEYTVMIPVTIQAMQADRKALPGLAAFSLGAMIAAFLLFLVMIFTVNGMSDRGMGIIIFLIFPLASALLGGLGLLAGIIYLVKKARGEYQTMESLN